METKDEAGGPVPLAPRPTSHPLVRILQKLGLRTLAWVGVYLLGYFDFSLGWMVTPLLLSVLRCPVITVSIVTIHVITVIGHHLVLRDHWKKEKRDRLAAAREAALSNEQAMLEARQGCIIFWQYRIALSKA